jgi:uncharacterized membrane protein
MVIMIIYCNGENILDPKYIVSISKIPSIVGNLSDLIYRNFLFKDTYRIWYARF